MMRPEDAERLQTMTAQLDGVFDRPTSPETAIPRVLAAIAALTPIGVILRDETLVGVEWLTPALLDAFERTGTVLQELYDELESSVDEVTLLEPGTLGAQNLVDVPTRQGRPAVDGRPPGARGELIR